MQTNNKFREALEAAKNFVDNVGMAALSDNIDAITICQCAAKLSGRIEAALAEPVKNCDVGTAEEQAQRFRTFCEIHFDNISCKCGDCPAKYYIDGWGIPCCQLKWAQMPYKEGGAK